MIADARHYADEVLPTIADAERLAEEDCDGRILPPSDDALNRYRALLKVREDYDTLGIEKDYLEAQLKQIIGTASGIERVANWNTVIARRLDGERLKAERFDVYAAYLSEGRSRRFTLL